MGFGFPGWSHTVWRVTNLARYQRAADSYQGVRVVRLQRCAEAFVAAAMFACPVFANAGDTDVYTLPSVGQEGAYMVDWQSDTRAKVHTQLGSSIGDYTGGAQRIITFDKPYKVIGYGVDQCDEQIGLRMEMTQLVVRKTGKRTSAIVEIWKWTNIGGCQDGLVRYFGSPDDPGVAVNRVSLEDRLPVDDLVPGVVMAGFSEDTSIPGDGEPSIAQDVVTFQAGSATFRASGRTVPVEVSDRWVVFSLAGVQRAYARLVVDQKSGRETWLRTELKGGLPTRVNEALLVKPSTDAGFGSVKQASRIWQSAYDLSAPTQLFLHFYRDGTGERVVQNLDDGFEQRSPLNWQFVGSNIQFTRFVGSIKLDRYWEPLRDGLGRDKWVMESEFLTDPNGNVNPTFKLRVNLFADRGKAVPPTKR